MAILPLIELGSLWVGDVPTSPTRADFVDEVGNPITVTSFNGWTAKIYSPTLEDLGALDLLEDDGFLLIDWTVDLLETSGVYQIVFNFTDDNAATLKAEPFKFVVQELNGWLTLEMARSQWSDAPLDDVFLAQILDAAKTQCLAYAPVLAVDALVPVNYLHAQLMQARALYQSVVANQQDNIGVEGLQVRVFPLDFTIRALLRPKRAIGAMY
jgi:hypothetical protein